MNEIKIENGKVSAVAYIRVKREHICDCGCQCEIDLDIPDGVDLVCKLKTNIPCPKCGKTIVIPYGHHYVEGFRLLTKPRQIQ